MAPLPQGNALFLEERFDLLFSRSSHGLKPVAGSPVPDFEGAV
jgi:hypothetical protein